MNELETKIEALYQEQNKEKNREVLALLRKYSQEGKTLIVPVKKGAFLRLSLQEGDNVYVAFSSEEQMHLGPKSESQDVAVQTILEQSLHSDQVTGVLINAWGRSYYLPKVYIEMILGNQNLESEVNIVEGDITSFDGDCIVNAANASLLGGGGVDGAIHRKAGPQLLEECRQLGGCPTGQAKITKGYNLDVPYIIHTVGPIYAGKHEDSHALRDCYWNSLELARKYDLHSIAFPAISCGVYHFPKEDAASIALKTIADWLDQHSEYTMQVNLYCFDKEMADIYHTLTTYTG